MSFYNDYLKEREGLEVLETDYGFAAYKIRGSDCYIQDIYIKPEVRQKRFASRLADQICKMAKSQGCTILTGSVDTRAESAEASKRVLTGYGMKPYCYDGCLVYYSKEIL